MRIITHKVNKDILWNSSDKSMTEKRNKEKNVSFEDLYEMSKLWWPS